MGRVEKLPQGRHYSTANRTIISRRGQSAGVRKEAAMSKGTAMKKETKKPKKKR
jgi:hypothetical protein